MGWLQSRRLRYGVGAAGLAFLLFAVLRLVFVLGFSGIAPSEFIDNPALRETLSIGLRFDLRLAVLLILPLTLLAWLPRWNLTRLPGLRVLVRVMSASIDTVSVAASFLRKRRAHLSSIRSGS